MTTTTTTILLLFLLLLLLLRLQWQNKLWADYCYYSYYCALEGEEEGCPHL